MQNILYFLLGIVGYSFVEYAMHRWLLHGPMLKTHGEHHRNPTKHIRVPLFLIAPVCILMWWLIGATFMFGMLFCWLWSSVLHWRLHDGNLTAPWILRLRKHHMGHHRHVKTNYGVSSVIWDKLFGTHSR